MVPVSLPVVILTPLLRAAKIWNCTSLSSFKFPRQSSALQGHFSCHKSFLVKLKCKKPCCQAISRKCNPIPELQMSDKNVGRQVRRRAILMWLQQCRQGTLSFSMMLTTDCCFGQRNVLVSLNAEGKREGECQVVSCFPQDYVEQKTEKLALKSRVKTQMLSSIFRTRAAWKIWHMANWGFAEASLVRLCWRGHLLLQMYLDMSDFTDEESL